MFLEGTELSLMWKWTLRTWGGVTLTLRFHCYFVYSIHNMGTRVPKCNMVIHLNEVRAEQHVPSELRQYDI